MRMSEKKRSELYKAITDPIVGQRVNISRPADFPRNVVRYDINEVDDMLFALESKIWRQVHKTLKLEGPP